SCAGGVWCSRRSTCPGCARPTASPTSGATTPPRAPVNAEAGSATARGTCSASASPWADGSADGSEPRLPRPGAAAVDEHDRSGPRVGQVRDPTPPAAAVADGDIAEVLARRTGAELDSIAARRHPVVDVHRDGRRLAVGDERVPDVEAVGAHHLS